MTRPAGGASRPVSGPDIRGGFERLGLIGKKVVVHSSLGSFGHVAGGAQTVVAEMIRAFDTVMVPAFCHDSNAPHPEGDQPEQNGCDYSFYRDWTKPLRPFVVETASVDRNMGMVSRVLVETAGARRSDHAWHSWAAYGSFAEEIVNPHPWDTTNPPLERLAAMGGYALLMGVGLSSCTAVHIAEERAGRRPFIRWAVDRSGGIQRVSAAGCGKGFDRLTPYCEELFIKTEVSECRMSAAPLALLIKHATRVIEANPEITRCSDACLRCRDALLGGPVERRPHEAGRV